MATRALLPSILLLAAVAAPAAAADDPDRLQEVPLRPEGSQEGGELPFRRDLPPRGTDLGVEVGRIWTEGGATFASVTIRNTSPHELDEIELRCTALDRAGDEIAHPAEHFRKTAGETFGPGATRTVRLQVEPGTGKLASMSCSARAF